MASWGKWLLAIPFIVIFSLGVPALVAGRMWWFTASWSDATYVALIAGMWAIATGIQRPERRQRPRGLSRWLFALGLVLSIPVAVYDRTHGPAASHPAIWSMLGLVCFGLSSAVGFGAFHALGRHYAPDPIVLSGQRLIAKGVYRWVRHPMYTALLLAAIGLPLVARSLWGAAFGLVAAAPALWLRIREEERILLDAFGDEYRDYQSRTRCLIPFIF